MCYGQLASLNVSQLGGEKKKLTSHDHCFMLDDGEDGEEADPARELEGEEELDLGDVLAALRQIRGVRGFARGRRV